MNPIIDQNPDGKQGWYSAPNYRGTLDIVWPCLLTIFLCCWNAIHPGVPHPKSTWLQRWFDRIICLFLSTIAPETFVWFAYRERLWAKAGYEELVTIMGRKNWSMAHGFYAQMGGFAVKLISEDLGHNLSCEIGYVQADSIRRYLEQGGLNPNTWITEQEIQNKGKSDSLGKSLTILQLSWLLFQCSARLVQHLPLTTLEISTLAYIPCALVIYYLWWDKPYEINTPTYLDLHPIGTFTTNNCISASHISLNSSQSGVGLTVPDGGAAEIRHSSSRTRGKSWSSKASSTNSKNNCREACTSFHELESSPIKVHAYRTYGILRDCFVSNDSFETYSQACVTNAIFLLMGAVHLSAWNFTFVTTYERIAWRICSIIITVSIPLAWLVNRILDPGPEYKTGLPITSNTKDVTDAGPIRVIPMFKTGFFTVLETAYAVSRLYLAVEIFIALRAAPKGVYRTPEWSNFLPHIS